MNPLSEKDKDKDKEKEEHAAAPEPQLRKSKVKKSEALWLMSFSDLSLILISFFIMMLSMSKPDVKKYDNVQTEMAAKSPVREKREDNLRMINDKLLAEVKKRKLQKSTEVKLDSEGLAIEFKDALLFASGSSDANPKFEGVVGQVMQIIASSPDRYHLVIEGHTDDTPVRGGDFPSNWELSAARGFTLMRQFQTRGVKETRISVEAFAHTRPKVPTVGLKGNLLASARSANRRVVIRIR